MRHSAARATGNLDPFLRRKLRYLSGMPYQWLPPAPDGALELRLWPHRSLTRRGFAGFIGVTALLIALPLIGLIGKPVLWGVLPFLVVAVAGIWVALRKSERDREIIEVLTLAQSRATLVRTGPGRQTQSWEANPHWVQTILHPTGGPVPNYLTLRGAPREVELGAFLTEDERIALCGDLSSRLSRLRGSQ